MPLERINIPTFLDPRGSYHHVVKDGNTVYLSGAVGFVDKDGNLAGDAAGQIEQTFKNIQTALTFVGSDMRHIIKMNVYLTHLEDYATIRDIRPKYIPDDSTPAATLIICGLAIPDMRIEVDIIASIL